jgi:hypothetical protein
MMPSTEDFPTQGCSLRQDALYYYSFFTYYLYSFSLKNLTTIFSFSSYTFSYSSYILSYFSYLLPVRKH